MSTVQVILTRGTSSDHYAAVEIFSFKDNGALHSHTRMLTNVGSEQGESLFTAKIRAAIAPDKDAIPFDADSAKVRAVQNAIGAVLNSFGDLI